MKREASETKSLRHTNSFPCHSCREPFATEHSLHTHIKDNHTSARCQQCNVTLQSAKGLHIHNVLVHEKNRTGTSTVPQLDSFHDAQFRQLMQANSTSLPIGFRDLTFIDFTSKNFPLIAKAFCEKNPRRPSSDYHKFMCRICQCSFPCGSALKLHLETHPPDCMAVCMACDCNFIDVQKYEDHMIRHSQDKIVSSYVNTEGTDDNDMQAMVAKEDFLLVCGLKNNELVTKPKDLNKRKEDLKLNNKYYVRLGEAKPYHPEADLADTPPKSMENETETASMKIPTAVKAVNHRLLPPTLQMRPEISAPGGATVRPMPPLQRMEYSQLSPRTPQIPQQGARLALAQMMESPRQPIGIKQEVTSGDEGDSERVTANGIDCKDDSAVLSADKGDRETGPFRCDFCEDVFTNYRVYKGDNFYLVPLTLPSPNSREKRVKMQANLHSS